MVFSIESFVFSPFRVVVHTTGILCRPLILEGSVVSTMYSSGSVLLRTSLKVLFVWLLSRCLFAA